MKKDNLTDHGFEDVSALIKEEEEQALAFFRSRDFENGLKRRLQETARGKKQTVLNRRLAAPALGAALVLIIAGIFLFVLRRSQAGPPQEFKALSFALAQLPGLSPHPEPEWPESPEKIETSRLAESVSQALVRAEQAKKQVEENIFVPAEKGKVPRLSLEQKMEILFQEKVIERALLLYKNDSKEV
jgi:hypothetical protein